MDVCLFGVFCFFERYVRVTGSLFLGKLDGMISVG